MHWRRLGRILEPPAIGRWAVSHAAVPIVRDADSSLELMFSPRDEHGRSHTARAILELVEGKARVHPAAEPVLAPGELGAFDDSGAMGGCLVREGGREYLFYIGWSLGVTVPFATFIGCAVSEDGHRFSRLSPAPIVGRSQVDPYFATTPWVLVENSRWRMWYASCVEWTPTEAGPLHRYRIVYAESADGLSWEASGRVCIDFENDQEYVLCRPCVVHDGDCYRMWFSCRGPAYRIGYAESEDGLSWRRDDELGGLRATGGGWESQAVEYACVFDHDGRRWMLYNGNGYGETGIGLAVLEESR